MNKFLIACLGNIGGEYANTRHNIGFLIADQFAKEANAPFRIDRLAAVAEVKVKGKMFILVKPSTFMNLSGKAVNYWMQAEKIALENILVVADDIALPLGSIRIRPRGGDGGHNGLTSILETLNTDNFARLRFGVGSDFPKGKQVDYVLGEWTQEEKKILPERIAVAVEAIKSFGLAGLDRTMTQYNSK